MKLGVAERDRRADEQLNEFKENANYYLVIITRRETRGSSGSLREAAVSRGLPPSCVITPGQPRSQIRPQKKGKKRERLHLETRPQLSTRLESRYRSHRRLTDRPAGRPYRYRPRGRVARKEIKGFLRGGARRETSSLAHCSVAENLRRVRLCVYWENTGPARDAAGQGLSRLDTLFPAVQPGLSPCLLSLSLLCSAPLRSALRAEMRTRRTTGEHVAEIERSRRVRHRVLFIHAGLIRGHFCKKLSLPLCH